MKKTITLDDGRTVWFSSSKLKAALRRKKEFLDRSGEKCSQYAIMEDIAEKTGISFSAIKHWCAGHNAPSDPDKVRDLAEALDVQMEDLLEFKKEENLDMTAYEFAFEKNIDHETAKDAVRNVYANMAKFIEMFRMKSLAGGRNEGMELKMAFLEMYGTLMYARLDIPKKTYDQLCAFAVNYLQQFGSYLWYFERVFVDGDMPAMCEASPSGFVTEYRTLHQFAWADGSECLSMAINPSSEDCEAFEEAMYGQFEMDTSEMFVQDVNEVIIDGAYKRLEKILAEYMIG